MHFDDRTAKLIEEMIFTRGFIENAFDIMSRLTFQLSDLTL